MYGMTLLYVVREEALRCNQVSGRYRWGDGTELLFPESCCKEAVSPALKAAGGCRGLGNKIGSRKVWKSLTLSEVQEIRATLPAKCVAAQERPGSPSVLAGPRSGCEEDLQSRDGGSCTGRAASLLVLCCRALLPGASRGAQSCALRAET